MAKRNNYAHLNSCAAPHFPSPPHDPPTYPWLVKELASVTVAWIISILILVMSPANTSRSINISDPNITHPLKPNTISDVLLAILAIGLPIAAISFTERLVGSLMSASVFILGLLMSTAQVEIVTDVLKSMVGSPRPDFVARCLPVIDPSPSLLMNQFTCTGFEHEVLDGYKSFPSGHASLMSAAMLYLTMYWHSRIIPTSNRRLSSPLGLGWAMLLSHFPVLIALLVSITRIIDNRHSAWDVVGGIVIGCIGTLITFPRYDLVASMFHQHSGGGKEKITASS